MLEENTFTPGEIPIIYLCIAPPIQVDAQIQTQHKLSSYLISLHLSWTHPNHNPFPSYVP
jgi:hypothetical protein